MPLTTIIRPADHTLVACEVYGPLIASIAMVWSIPLTDLAGALAVSFVSAPPVQRPSTTAPELPDAPPPVTSTEDPMPPSEPTPPMLPPTGEPIADPPPSTSPPMADAFVESRPPRRPPSAPEGADDEVAPVVGGSNGVPAKERLLRPTDKRRFFSLTAGGATGSSIYGAYYGGSGLDFQAEMAVGSHGIKRPHLGGAFVLQYRKGYLTEITFAGRVQWDRPLSKAFAIYSASDLTLGLNLPLGYAGYIAPSIPNAIISAGWGIKAILAERFLLIFKPVGPGLVLPSFASQVFVSFRWELGGGIGIVW